MSTRLKAVLDKQYNFEELYARYPIGEYPPRKVVSGVGVLPRVTMGGREYLQFSSLDYLGLATDSRVRDAAKRAIDTYGVGALASRIADGSLDIHERLEDAIAGYLNTEAAVAFTAGTLANIGAVLSTLASRLPLLLGRPPRIKKAFFVDSASHQSIRLGLEIADTRDVPAHKYRHGDIGHLEHLLERHPCDASVIVTDGVFSMDGDVAPLPKIVELAKQYGSVVYVDDAHGVGILGKTGRGTAELFGVTADIDIQVGVLSKAFGVLGGYVAGPRWFIDLVRLSETQIFTMAIPAAEAAAATEALRIAQDEPWRRERVLSLATYMRQGLERLGFYTMGSTTHIVPVLIGSERDCRNVVALLKDNGIVTTAYESPAVPVGKARLRFFPTANHSMADIDKLIDVMSLYAASESLQGAGDRGRQLVHA